MRKNKRNDVLTILQQHANEWMDLSILESYLGVSKRQVKNYIKEINAMITAEDFILFRKQEVRLCNDYHTYLPQFHMQDDTPSKRVSKIINFLLLHNQGIDAFDLADALFISRSTFDSDLKKVRRQLHHLNLSLSTTKDIVKLVGEEFNKRKLASYMLRTENYTNFLLNQSPEFLLSDLDINYIRDNLYLIFQNNHIYVNDYSLHNIVVHMIIIIDRIRNNCFLHKNTPDIKATIPNAQIDVTNDICSFIKDNFSLTIEKGEYNNLLLLISCNASTVDFSFVNQDNISQYIPKENVQITSRIMEKVQKFYYLDEFDDVFMTRFIIHINNMLNRIQNKYAIYNPLSTQIKNSYPLIYDIAVFIANELSKEVSIHISEDEMSFIAFHIGSFFENSTENKNKISAIYIYVDYYEMYQKNLEKLQKRFHTAIDFKYAISINDIEKIKLKANLIISEVPISLPTLQVITISPFLKDDELKEIENVIKTMQLQHQEKEFEVLLSKFFNKNLYYRNVNGSDKYEVIKNISKELINKGNIDEQFHKEVIEREVLSSTSFPNGIAIPHALHPIAIKSFISIIQYDEPIQWDDEKVCLVIYIGMSYEQRKDFRQVFNHLVRILSVPSNLLALSEAQNYKEFKKGLSELIYEENHG